MDEAAGTDNQTSVTWTEAEKKNSLSYSDIDQVERDFIKCVELVEQGTLSPEDALEWLQQVSEALVEVKHLSGWYKCKVAALRKTADQDALLAVFEQAIINNAQPAHEMAQLLTDTMKELLSQPSRKRKSSTRTPASSRRVRSEHAYAVHSGVDEENIFRSTAVRYSVMEVTPFKKRRRLTSTSACDSAVIPVITPVRRSTRVSTSHATPTCKSNARKSAPCAAMEFSALEDVPSAEKERMLFQPNQALEPLLGDSSPRFRDVSTIVCDSVPPVADGSPLLVPRFSAMKLGKEPVVE